MAPTKVEASPSASMNDEEITVLLKFLIHHKKSFDKPYKLFKAAQEKFASRNAGELEEKYKTMATSAKWKLVDSTNEAIPANTLTMEQRLEIAVLERIDLDPKFVKDVVIPYFVNKEKEENLPKKMEGASISDNKTEAGKSSSAAIEVKNSAKSSASPKQASTTTTPVAKSTPQKSKK